MFVKKILRPTVQQLQYMSKRRKGSDGDDETGSISAIVKAGATRKRGKAMEDEYFYKLQLEQLRKLKAQIRKQIDFHEKEIERHQEAVNRNKSGVDDKDENND